MRRVFDEAMQDADLRVENANKTLGERHWRVAAIALLSARFIQGFIYWGGGSRRFIYGPEKLHPDAPTRSRRIASRPPR